MAKKKTQAKAKSKPSTFRMPATSKRALERGATRTCPYAKQPGYVLARAIPDTLGGGWAVLYDRASGPPGLTSEQLPWSEQESRWLVMWRGSTTLRNVYKAYPNKDTAKEVLTKLRKGFDECGWFKSIKPKLPENFDELPSASPARAREASDLPSAPLDGGSPPPPTPPPPPNMLPMPQGMNYLEQWRTVLLQIGFEEARKVIVEGMSAVKVISVDGRSMTMPDFPVRLEAVRQWKEDWGGKNAIAKATKTLVVLDDSHLQDSLLVSPAAREEVLRIAIDAMLQPRDMPTAVDPEAKETPQQVLQRVLRELGVLLAIIDAAIAEAREKLAQLLAPIAPPATPS